MSILNFSTAAVITGKGRSRSWQLERASSSSRVGSREPRRGTGQRGPVRVEAPATDVVDTIGAGDSFQAALLFALRAIGRIKRGALAEMTAGELDRALSFASACAAVTCSRAGADPPRQSDVGPALSRLFVG